MTKIMISWLQGAEIRFLTGLWGEVGGWSSEIQEEVRAEICYVSVNQLNWFGHLIKMSN